MADELKTDLRVEYAKSSRSACKKCGNPIEQATARIGKMERSAHFDGEIPVWHHVKCFFMKYPKLVTDAMMLKGLDSLMWDDQQKIKSAAGLSGGSAPAGDDEDDEDSDDGGECQVEYAKSGRSSCKKCGSTIANGECRIGDEYNGGNYTSVNWHHVACWECPPHIQDPGDIVGYNKLKPADKKSVKAVVDNAAQENKKKRKAQEDLATAGDAKRQKQEAEDKARADAMWKIKQKLEKKYNANEMRAILKYNDQSISGGPGDLLTRLVDIELNSGGLPKCAECSNGHLHYEHGVFKCHGFMSAYSKCTFETKNAEDIKRTKFKWPKESELEDLVEDMKEEKKTKKAAETEAIFSPTAKQTSQVFAEQTLTFIGSFEDKDVAEEKVESAGGSVVSSVTKKVTLVISTFEEVSKAKKTAKLTNAIKQGLPILDPHFITYAIAKNSLADKEKFLVWKDDKPNAVADTEKKGALAAEKASGTGEKKKKRMAIPPVDAHSDFVETSSILVENDEVYAVTLNLTDLSIGQTGKNSYYIIQLLKHNAKASQFIVFTRWGRIGDDGNCKDETFSRKTDALAEFKKKFYERTRNAWDTYVFGDFEKQPGKFVPVELDADDEDEEADDKTKEKKKQALAVKSAGGCKLDPRVQELVKLIFNQDMMQQQMKELEIDTEKMPLGKLSKDQIKKGEKVLEEIETELTNAEKEKRKPKQAFLVDATNRFYSHVPHYFPGGTRPTIIETKELLQKKYDLIGILGDIEIACRLSEGESTALHPMDEKYATLKNKVSALDRDSDEYQRLERYLNNTQQDAGLKILDIYKIDREGEADRFAAYKDVEHRKLLWHGSNVAVFAAILATGLKIMPHAGGRVGKGLYFADMINKSQGYCGLHGNVGLILLNEVVLGKQFKIQQDRPDLKVAPPGYDSVLAQGTIMPKPNADFVEKSLSPSGHPVIIPQAPEYTVPNHRSSFYHNEYLVYDSAMVYMRYLVRLEWTNRKSFW